MKLQKSTAFFVKVLVIVALFGWLSTVASAQEEPPEPVARLIISDTNVEAIPTVGLRIYGRDEQGNPIDFNQRGVTVQSGDVPVGPVTIQGEEEVGTFTIFLIDIPTGVANQLGSVQEIIQTFASPGVMKEQVDYVAVYQVGLDGPVQLLEPVPFHNSVRNLFVTPLTPETGATALVDSTVEMLERAAEIQPKEGVATSIVLITDGTDSISTDNAPEDVAQVAAGLGIPVHTLWLLNDDLGNFSQDVGQEYLAELAANSGGIAALLLNREDWPLIWNRIGAFRTQTRLAYTAAALEPGEATVVVSLADEPTIQAETAVTIPDNIPSIVIDLPADARTLSMPSLERPLTLRFNTTLQWLDGVERTLEAAQFAVNGETVADIPVGEVNNFTVTTDQLQYGNNVVEVVVMDEQGIVARSPELILSIEEGAQSIPTELATRGGNISVTRTILISVVILGFAVTVWVFALRNGWLRSAGTLIPRGRRGALAREPQVVISDENVSYSVNTQPLAFLDVVNTKSPVSGSLPLRSLTVKIGRSPSQSDITFDQDITVSRVHATLRLEGNHYRIYDEQSTSGTWVNDRQVPEYGTQLQSGDEIHLGEVVLRFRQQ